jgi:protein-S-isoprenylcysteine O-methyltransferase Ste14
MSTVHMFCFKNRWLFCSAFLIIALSVGWQLRHVSMPSPTTDVAESVLAWCMLILGLALRFWSTLYIGGNKSKQLVDLGPYSICRNPLYVANLIIFLSIGVFLRSWMFLASTVVLAAFYHWFVIRYEEANLARRLGPAYEEYRRRVPTWWPNFSLYRDSPYIHVKTKNLFVELRRTSTWVFIPLAIELIRFRIG